MPLIANMPQLKRLDMIITGAPTMTVREAVDLLVAGGVGAMPVVDGKKIVGMFSERDLLVRVVGKKLDADELILEEVMTHNPITIGKDKTKEEALSIMKEKGFRHLPVVEGEQMVGVLSIRDFL